MRRLTRLLDRFSRPLKIAIQVGILLIILGAIGTVGFIQYSGQPSFCTNCHVMQPYYDSWASSSHNTVKCIECHYAPGIKAEAMGKVQAANQVVKYITGAYGIKPWAEIEDAACLRSGCHTERELEGEVNYAGVRFDHTHHLGEMRRGKNLRCTSCHSQIVQGSHVTVTAETCNLCHFKDRPRDAPIAGCTGCHTSPPRFTSPAGFVVDHPEYVKNLVSCTGCHENVITGSGIADRDRCFTCHNEPERLNQFDNTTLVHRVHIAESKVECTQCHTSMLHQVVSLTATFELDCRACHQRTHDEQRLMYAGMGGHGTENVPSSMYLARVSCQSCHGIPADLPGHEEVERAGEATCMSCHGIRYANILPAWQQEMQRRQKLLASIVQNARRLVSSAPVRTRALADSLIGAAEENLRFVEHGKGAHNIAYADRLLRASLELVREATQTASLPYSVPEVELGPSLTENVCIRCHLDIPQQAGDFAGVKFDHAPHVQRSGLTCSDCHTPLDDHGKITLAGAASCQSCHHRAVEPLNCASCHPGPGGAPTKIIPTSTGDFKHPVHRDAGLACAVCHQPPEMSAAQLNCNGCHVLHHRPKNTCLSCHRDGVIGFHPPAAHSGCTLCHGEGAAFIDEWTRPVCTVCHADKTEHNAPANCVLCHTMPAPGKS